MTTWLLKMIHMQNKGIITEKAEEAFKLFSQKKEVEKWLINHGFVYGKCDDFMTEGAYWFHQKDRAGDYVIVEMEEMIIDDFDRKIEWVDSLQYRALTGMCNKE